MKTKPLRKDIGDYLIKHNLEKKFQKALRFFEEDHKHPSLNTELLEPKKYGIYSFRIDKKIRALFFIKD